MAHFANDSLSLDILSQTSFQIITADLHLLKPPHPPPMNSMVLRNHSSNSTQKNTCKWVLNRGTANHSSAFNVIFLNATRTPFIAIWSYLRWFVCSMQSHAYGQGFCSLHCYFFQNRITHQGIRPFYFSLYITKHKTSKRLGQAPHWDEGKAQSRHARRNISHTNRISSRSRLST